MVVEYAQLRRILIAEAPSGDTGLENEYRDGGRVRKDEADLAEVGRVMQVTLVRSAHRGHGLGLALKIHTMHASTDPLERRRRIITENAARWPGPASSSGRSSKFRDVVRQ